MNRQIDTAIAYLLMAVLLIVFVVVFSLIIDGVQRDCPREQPQLSQPKKVQA